MPLTLVLLQLILPGMQDAALIPAAPVFRADPTEWNEATVKQRVKNALLYCQYQASKWQDRHAPERWWYMHGIRTLSDVFYAPTRKERQLSLSGIESLPHYSPCELELMKHSRAALVTRLTAAAPHYTDQRLLLSLSRAKLAQLIVRAESDAPAESERRRA